MSTTDSTSTTARLVARNSTIRFMTILEEMVGAILARPRRVYGTADAERGRVGPLRSGSSCGAARTAPTARSARCLDQESRSVTARLNTGWRRRVIDEIGDEIAVPLELDALLRRGA